MIKHNGVCFSECWYMVRLMRLGNADKANDG